MIEPGTPVWNDLMDQLLLFARVSTAAGGEEISDDVQVSVAMQRLKPGGGFGEIEVLPASKLGNALSFRADATGLEPQLAEQFRFWWGATKQKPPLVFFDVPAGANKTDHQPDEPYVTASISSANLWRKLGNGEHGGRQQEPGQQPPRQPSALTPAAKVSPSE